MEISSFTHSAAALGLFIVASCVAACDVPPQTSRSAGAHGADGLFGISPDSIDRRHATTGATNRNPSQRGTDDFLGEESSSSGVRAIVVPAGDETIQISLVSASIESAAKAVLGDSLGLNYVVADGLEGQITIQTTGPVPKSTLLDLFEASLNANNLILREDKGVLRIVAGTSGNTTFRVAGPGGVIGSSIMVAPLKFISATEMVKLLEPLTEQGLKVVAEQQRNLLLLSGSPELMEAALDALNLFDIDVLQGKSVALVRLKSADPNDVVVELTEIFEAEEGGLLNGVIEFIPNPRLGSILVMSSRAAYLDKAQRWIRELDQSAAGSDVYLETYSLQNRSASEVAPILTELLGGKAALATSPETEADQESYDISLNEERMTVAADDSRNALIVRGNSDDHAQIASILRSLDSPARQVLLEATIAEVTLNDEIQVGTRWFFEDGNWDFKFSDLSSGAVSGNNPGFTAVFGVGGADVALSALSGVTNVKIISSPTLMVLDNKEGILQIGDQVPIASRTSTSTEDANAPVISTIEYRDTGIILRVKPRVSDGGRVTLEISQEVSDVAANTVSGIDSPTIRQRKVQTSVALGNGQTLALGGLVQEGDNVSRSAVPGLGEVPVIGNLFRNKKSRKNRTELLILIRPRVVTNDQEAAAATTYWRTKVSGSDSILATGLGSGKHTVYDFAN